MQPLSSLRLEMGCMLELVVAALSSRPVSQSLAGFVALHCIFGHRKPEPMLLLQLTARAHLCNALQHCDSHMCPTADVSDVAPVDAGAPLEISKRHAMPVLLCIRLGNLCSELVFTGGCASAGHQDDRLSCS